MKFIYTLIALTLFAVQIHAQQTYTEKLRQNEAGKGTVVVNHSAEIDQVVNGKKAVKKTATNNRAVTLPMTNGKPVATTTPNAKIPKRNVTNTPANHAVGSNSANASHNTTHNAGQSKENKNVNSSRQHATRNEERNVNSGGHNAYHSYVNRARHKARGYRICIFTGGNSRADKQKAIKMGNKCRSKFPELASYASFEAPRWVMHVGDFKTREEAQKYVRLIRRSHISHEVRIVASEVNIPY